MIEASPPYRVMCKRMRVADALTTCRSRGGRPTGLGLGRTKLTEPDQNRRTGDLDAPRRCGGTQRLSMCEAAHCEDDKKVITPE